jgi:uncharacterized coiled-coil DUF342 family protein
MNEGYDTRLKKTKKKTPKPKVVAPANRIDAATEKLRELEVTVEKVRQGLLDFLQAEMQFSDELAKELDTEFEGIHADIESSFRHDQTTTDELKSIQDHLKALETRLKGVETILVNKGFASWPMVTS